MAPHELPTIEDTLGDLHEELDAQVNGDPYIEAMVSTTLSEYSTLPLLCIIIKHSGGRLNNVYLTKKSLGMDLIEKYPLLLEKLLEAWAIKQYRSIRLLEILQAPAIPIEMNDAQRKQLSASFRAPFLGAAVEGFFEYLENHERLFRAHKHDAPYYAKFCSIVQSSGTGKSRVLTELSKRNVVVLYINLRDEYDTRGFPFRDLIPCTILESNGSEDEYTYVCEAFMTALFETSQAFLETAAAEKGVDKAVQHWTNTLCNMELSNVARNEFFLKVQTSYDRWREICSNVPSSDPDVQQVADELRTLSLSGLQGENRDTVNLSRTAFLQAYRSLGAYLERIIKGPATQPRFVLAIDEAHPLGKPRTSASQSAKEYRPADILTRVINAYSHHAKHAIWVVFASTTSRVADFSPPNRHHPSLRIAIHGHQLFPPYTQLGWDQHAQALGQNADDIAQISHILTYGRPLWKSLLQTVDNPQGMLAIASKKLFGGGDCSFKDIGHVLAAFGQRFALEVTLGHPDSVQALETAVASHLRICLSTTLDRSWIYTSYPSEPLLSCVAASQLHSSSSHLALALETLEGRIRQGMINIGEHGELTSRLLWLLAKDLYVREKITNSEDGLVPPAPGGDVWSAELLDCKMIPVVGWLEFVFGESVFGPSDEDRQRVRACFANACVNFSHWLSMDSNVSGGYNDLPLDQWTLRHWQRTSAVQCTHNQPLIDKVIPIYFKDPNNPVPVPGDMSQIFISDKARQSDSKRFLNHITRNDPSLGRLSSGRPYIAILCDFGLTSSVLSATFPARPVDDCCLRIYAAGIDTTTYQFLGLEKHPGLLLALRNIVSLQKQPENDLPRGKYLDAQVRFGKAPTAEYMNWEHGKELPRVAG